MQSKRIEWISKALTKQQFVVLTAISMSASAIFLVSNWSHFIQHKKYTSCKQCRTASFHNRCWLKGDIHVVGNNVISVWCCICCKQVERLCCFCNFRKAFVRPTGISGSAIRRNALTKHMRNAAHIHAETTEITFHCVFLHPFSFTNWILNI